MNILYIANVRIPTEKAHGLQIAKTVEAFQSLGNKIELLVPARRNQIKENFFIFYSINNSPDIGIKFISNYFGFLENVHKNLYFKIQRLYFTLLSFFYGLKSGSDVIYTRDIIVGFLLSLFRKNVVFEDHEPKKSKIFFYKLFVRTIRKKVVVASNLAHLYLKFKVNSMSFIESPNGVDLSEFNAVSPDKNIWLNEFGFSQSDKVALYIGHFYQWKGVYTAADSTKFLDSNIKIVLIGGTEHDQKILKKYIQDKEINNIYIKKFISHQQVIKYTKSADVLLLPNTAKEERSAKYTTPLKLFEYMASSAPIIASKLDSFSEYLQDEKNAIFCQPDDPKDLAKKIMHILAEEKLANSLAEQASKDVQKYSWTNRAKKIIKFIND